MKRIPFLFLILVILMSSVTVVSAADSAIKVYLDGRLLTFDVKPVIEDGRTMVPMRAIFETLKADVTWEAATRTITSKREGIEVTLHIDNPTAVINGQKITMDVPARIRDGSTLVPLRFVSESLKSTVAWNASEQVVRIYSYPEVSLVYAKTLNDLTTNDYLYGNSFRVSNRYMYAESDRIHMLESSSAGLSVTDYDLSFNLLTKTNIPMELPIFGGFHASRDGYYYVVYGEKNDEESDEKTVISVVKYDNNWNKVGQSDIKDVYISEPFNASNLTMDDSKGLLAVHTARTRYRTAKDGLRHQSNISLLIDTNQMSVLSKGGQWPSNHVSHSFASYVRFDGERIVYVDHGDAYPRSIVLQTELAGRIEKKLDILKFPGAIGANYTGATLGGFEVAGTNYLVVGSSNSVGDATEASGAQNLFLSVIPKTAGSSSEIKTRKLTDLPKQGTESIEETHISKINDNKFVIIWKQKDEIDSTFYAVIDGEGNYLKDPTKLSGIPSPGNMSPLVQGDNLMWYSLDGKQIGIYSLDVSK